MIGSESDFNLVLCESDEPDHDEEHDVNDNMKMQQSQSSQELDLVMAEPEDFTEYLTKSLLINTL